MTNFPVKFPHVSPEVKLKYEEFTISSEKEYSQCPEINFNKISNTIHKNYIELTSMLQGFQKCIA